MLHLMKYSLLTKVKNISAIFWPLIFPLLLATMMYFAVGAMEESDFETIPVALVAETDLSKGERGVQTEEVFQAFLSSVETDSELIHVEEMTEEQALKALENREVKGIFYSGSEPSLTVGSNGLAETILQMLLESYSEGKQTMEDIARLHPQGMEAAVRQMAQSASAVEQVSLGGRTTNGSAQAFYAVIGMACLYGCFLGFGSAMEIQANLTALAARRCAGPVHRMKMVFSEIIVCFGLHFANTLILLTYMKYILRLEFAGSYAEMVPVLLVGSMIGVTMGIFITSIGKTKEGVKIGIMLAFSMTFSFLAGMMNVETKNLIDRHAPFINRINPAALISDALYCLNVYDAPKRYAQDLAILSVLCVLLAAGTFLIIRRKRYGSI